MSSYSPPVLGLDTYTPQTPAAHTVEQPSGLLGMAFTPEAIEARAAGRGLSNKCTTWEASGNSRCAIQRPSTRLSPT